MDYPLEELVAVKKRRFDEAVKVLEEKKRILTQEQEKLKAAEKIRDEALHHKNLKLQQLRDALDAGEPSEKILQMKAYMKVVTERLNQEEKKVEAQKKVVAGAEENVKKATQEMYQKKKDVEKLDIHKVEWGREESRKEAREEEKRTDEQGSTQHTVKKSEKKRRA